MFSYRPKPWLPKRQTAEPTPPPVVVPETVAPPAPPDRREHVEEALDRIQEIATGRHPRPKSEPNRVEYSFGCTGLCAGDGCARCQELADRITAAKDLPPGVHRSGLLALLAAKVQTRMGVRS